MNGADWAAEDLSARVSWVQGDAFLDLGRGNGIHFLGMGEAEVAALLEEVVLNY